jgi:general secretion pathway protein I
MTRRNRQQAGFTLLEVIVATLIMALAVGSLVQALTQSARNTGRVVDHDRAALLARRKMDELLAMSAFPVGRPFGGQFDSQQVGTTAGWSALATMPNLANGVGPGMPVMQRIQLKIWWMEGAVRKEIEVGGYRRAQMNEDLMKSAAAAANPQPGVIQ